MSPNQVLAHLRREPFQPFRIYISDGASYEVRHPENALVTRTDVAIAVDGTPDLPERMVYCDPLHITRIEPLEPDKGKRAKKRSS